MRFEIAKKSNARKIAGRWDEKVDVTDVENGNCIGYVETGQGGWAGETRIPTRRVSLFDGKYRGQFDNHDECAGFVKGVEAVLNHIVSLADKKS